MIDNKTLVVMVRHCNERSCDGCPGVALHCTGRDYLTHEVSAALQRADAAIAGAVRPWREALERTTDAVDEHRLIGVAYEVTKALINFNRALLAKAGA